MELYQLRTFLTVADEGHLTRAAEKLFTSQPAVRAQIRALEDELGVRLFDRGSRGMTLTGAGVTLQEQARKIVNAARDFKMTAEGLRGTVTGELVFGLNNRPEILRLMDILRVRLTGVEGQCWVTQQGDRHDYLLAPGETLSFSGPGRLVFEAVADSATLAVS